MKPNFELRVIDRSYTESAAVLLLNHILQHKMSFGFLKLQFRNTSLLYSREGYGGLDGHFRKVAVGGYEFIVSPQTVLDADSLQELRFEPLVLPEKASTAQTKVAGSLPLSIIVPVYGSLYHSHLICRELQAVWHELPNSDVHVHIGIDFHGSRLDDLHAEVFSVLDSRKVTIWRHRANQGFVGNCNFLFEKTERDGLVLLWTTDVRVAPGTLARVLEPLRQSEDIALATPYAYGGANLQAPDSGILHWRDFDRVLAATQPKYPDAETTVGYFMAVDRRKYLMGRLFDTAFINGYGDDSDLYYRCVNLGLRGVLVDNACVYHEHGASFDHTGQRKALQDVNFQTFMARWGEAHASRAPAMASRIAAVSATARDLANSLQTMANRADIVFVLPTNDRRIGGVRSVFDIAEGLRDHGVRAVVLCASMPLKEQGAELNAMLLNDGAACSDLLAGCSIVVATAHDTAPMVKELAQRHGKRAVYFVQGPEFSFAGGAHLASVVNDYAGFSEVWVVSGYLAEIVSAWTDAPVRVVPYGPQPHRYFETGRDREPKSIAVQFNGRLDKGADYAAAVVVALKKHGYRFYSFGSDELRDTRQNFCTHVGFLSYAEKLALFNKVEFFLDASHFEGLGLLLMESSQCGAIPAYRNNGGSAAMLRAAGAGIEVGDYGAIQHIPDLFNAFRERGDWAAERERCRSAFRHHSAAQAVAAVQERVNASH